ncbi:FkbM family methyltransferase [Hugenholtzia roseola]|uniref:FkbM family methyltransferase n=1 Tax=Hugenholtzia roseola TaxID=1002 RepID=UPI0003FBD2BE|nr:FkbM family methyltransferase [Hugenholtzia roseola]
MFRNIISSLFPEKVKHYYRLRKYPEYRQNYEEEQELLRLKHQKQEITSNLLGFPFKAQNGLVFVKSYEEIYQKNNYYFETDKAAPVIIDCGSNVGMSILYFKKLYPNAKIIGFEPDAYIYSLLKENITLFSDIEVYQKAVWTEDTTLSFVLEGNFSSKVSLVDDKSNSRIVKVEAVDLNKFLEQKVDFFKIDVEGAEYYLIEHIAPKLVNVDKIFIEYHSFSEKPQNLSVILNILEKQGFRYDIKQPFPTKRPFIDQVTRMREKIFDTHFEIYGFKL